MKEYILQKYKKYNKFSVFGGGDETKKYYARLQANADALGNTFQRLTPPFSSDLKLSTAKLTACDLVSEGPIEGFVNSKGESCSALEAIYLDGTVVAEPQLSNTRTEGISIEKLSGVSYDFSSFVSGKLNEYQEDLQNRFIHKEYAPSANWLFPFGNFRANSSFRGGLINRKRKLSDALNNTAEAPYNTLMSWNLGRRYAGNLNFGAVYSTSIDPQDSNMTNRSAGHGYRKVPYAIRKIYHPDQVNYNNNFTLPNPYVFQTNNPVLYQGSYDFGASLNSTGRLMQSFCTRAFFKILHSPGGSAGSSADNQTFLGTAMKFNDIYGSYFPDGKPSKYRYEFADDFEPDGLKEPIIDAISEKINDLGLNDWKPYRFYNSDPSIITGRITAPSIHPTYTYVDCDGLYNLFSYKNAEKFKETILGKDADKFICQKNNDASYLVERPVYDAARSIKPNKTYRFTGSIYIPSSNNSVNSLRLRLFDNSTKTTIRITGGTTDFPFDQWNDFDIEYTNPDNNFRRIAWQLYENNSNPGTSASGDFFALNNFSVLEKTTGRDVTANTGNFAYMTFCADDFFGSSNFAKDYELTYAVDGDRLEIQDEKGLGFSFPEVTGFDLTSKQIRESIAYEYPIQSNNTSSFFRFPIITGATNAQNLGVELNEAASNKFKGAFLYPVYLGERFIPLESDGIINTGIIFIAETDSATVSGNKVASGISGDYDVFSTKSGKIGEEDIVTGQQLILNSGISGTRYAGYYNDNVNFSRATVQARYYTNSIQQADFGSSYTTEFVGFFRARHNGAYGFRVASDDASHLWVGNDATGGFTTSNATINNGGTHSNRSESANVTLQSGKVYGFRAMQGENGGDANFNVYFTPPGGSETSNFAGYFYTYSGSNKIDPEVLSIQNDSGFYNFTNDASGSANLLGKQDVSGKIISYAHLANPNIKVPDVEVTGKSIQLRIREKAPGLFNFSNFNVDFNLGEEDQKPLTETSVTATEYNKSIYGPTDPNESFDSSLILTGSNNDYSSYGMRENSAIDGTSSSDVESDGTFQSDWMANPPLDSDVVDLSHKITRKDVDCVKVTFIIESLYQEILAEQDPLGATIKTDAIQINFSVFTSFDGVPESIYPAEEKKISYYGTVTSFYAVDSDEIVLPTYSEIADHYPDEDIASLAKRFPRKVVIRKNDFETTSTRIGRRARVFQVLEIIKESFSYPFSAVMKTQIDARTFKDPPNKQYQLRLRRIKIPSNYFPLDLAGKDKRFVANASDLGTRVIYEGDWDGTFKIGWTDNPAWILYDIITNQRYGIGNRIDDLEDINIFNLYKIGRYCDGVDDNGHFVGVSNGLGGLEPRFSCNIMLDAANNAFNTIKDIASVFNGMAFWANGRLDFFADQPKDPMLFFNNGNVLDGIFNYQTTNKSSLFNVAEVTYLDKRDDFTAKNETFMDEDGMRDNGIVRRAINARGATSRAQAARLGRYILYSNKLEREIVNFKASSEALMLSIGDIIEVQDELKNFEANYAEILKIESEGDKFIEIENRPNTNSIINNNSGAFVVVPTGQDKLSDLYNHITTGGSIGNQELSGLYVPQVRELKITGVTDLTTKIKLGVEDPSGYLDHVPTGTLINLDLQNRTPKQYRVLKINPEETNLYSVTATEYRREKFDLIENSIDFTLDDPEPFGIGIPENEIKALSEPEGFSSQVVDNNYGQQIDFSISGNLTGNETVYEVSVIQPNGNVESKKIAKQPTTQNGYFKTTGTFNDITSFGTYTFEVKSIDSKDIFGGVEFSKFNTLSNTDSDGDGLSDWDEIHTHGTDPNNSDTDGDGLSDGAEVNTHGTDPLDTDSDDDGLSDGDEVNTHNTDPLDADSDDDGLTDEAEVNTHNTDPLDADSDDDGFSDSIEVEAGTDPNDDTNFPSEQIAATMEVSGLSVNSDWQGTWTKVAGLDGATWSNDGGNFNFVSKVTVSGTEKWEMEFPEDQSSKYYWRSKQDTTKCPYPWRVFSWEWIGFGHSGYENTGEPFIYGAKDPSSNLIVPTDIGTEVRSFDFDANINVERGDDLNGTYIYSGYMKGLPFYALSGSTAQFLSESFLYFHNESTQEFTIANLGQVVNNTFLTAYTNSFDDTVAYGQTRDASGYLLWSNEFTWTGQIPSTFNSTITPTFSNFKDKDGNTVSNP